MFKREVVRVPRIPGLLQRKSQYERYAAGLENNQSRFRAEEEGTRSKPTKKEKRAVKKKFKKRKALIR